MEKEDFATLNRLLATYSATVLLSEMARYYDDLAESDPKLKFQYRAVSDELWRAADNTL